MNRDLNLAREAYQRKDIELSKKAHDESLDSLKQRNHVPHKEEHSTGGLFIKSAVYGGLDGLITTYSVVMGVLGVNYPSEHSITGQPLHRSCPGSRGRQPDRRRHIHVTRRLPLHQSRTGVREQGEESRGGASQQQPGCGKNHHDRYL